MNTHGNRNRNPNTYNIQVSHSIQINSPSTYHQSNYKSFHGHLLDPTTTFPGYNVVMRNVQIPTPLMPFLVAFNLLHEQKTA